MANPYFNASYYLANNLDVLAAGYTVETAEQHYLNYGAAEALSGANAARKPAPYFDIQYYLTSNPDLLANGIGADTAFWHFTTYGQFEQRSPANGLTVTDAKLTAYANANADLVTAFGITNTSDMTKAQKDALTGHFYQYGYKEDRPAAPFESDTNAGKTFTLTTAIDNLTGTAGDDVFSGVFSAAGTTTGADGTSFNIADILDGAGGKDAVSYIVMGDANGKGAANSIAPANLKAIEQFVVRNLATDSVAGGEEVHTLNLTGVTGVTEVKSQGSAAGVTFTNIGKTAAVTVDAVTAGTTTFSRGTAAVTDALTINVANGVKGGSINSDDLNNDATAVTINSTGAKNVVTSMNVTGTATSTTHTATTVTVNAETDLTIGTIDGTADLTGFDTSKAATITVTGAGKVALNDLAGAVKTLNASANTGGVTAVALSATLQEVTGGEGADSITLAGDLADKGFVKLGAGNDKLNIAGNNVTKGAVIELGEGDDSFVGTGTVNKDAVIDGGAGKDTLAAKFVNAVNVGAFSNFENLDLVGLGASTLDVDIFAAKNSIEKLVLSGASGSASATVSNVAAGVGLEITGSDTNGVVINQKGVTTGGTVVDTFTVTFNGEATTPTPTAKTITATSITLNSINEVTIVSDGGDKVSNVLTSLVSDELKTLKITGDNALQLTSLDQIAGTESTVLKTVDASGQTAGGLKMSLGAVNGVIEVKLGGGDDVITVTSGSSTITALDKISGFDKATDAELVATKGYDLLAFTNGVVATNVAGTTTSAAISNGVVKFDTLTSGPTDLAGAVVAVQAVVTAANDAAVFEYGSSTYFFVEAGATDLLVELTGVSGVTKLGEVGTTDTFYIA